jgi:hypothetical protein
MGSILLAVLLTLVVGYRVFRSAPHAGAPPAAIQLTEPPQSAPVAAPAPEPARAESAPVSVPPPPPTGKPARKATRKSSEPINEALKVTRAEMAVKPEAEPDPAAPAAEAPVAAPEKETPEAAADKADPAPADQPAEAVKTAPEPKKKGILKTFGRWLGIGRRDAQPAAVKQP